jgi:hypothetical protein
LPTYSLTLPTLEQIHAGCVGEGVGEPDLAEVRPSAGTHDLVQVTDAQDAQPSA